MLTRTTSFWVIAAMLCLCATAALAAVTVHYFTAQCVNDQLVADFKVSGLGQLRHATFTVAAKADVVVTCVNKGAKGKEPPGLIHTTADVVASKSFLVTQGQVTGRLVTVPLDPASFQDECPPGMAAMKVDVTAFHDVTLLDPVGNPIAYIGTVTCPD